MQLRSTQCRFYDHVKFGYGCEVTEMEFLAGDELTITGVHLTGRGNGNVAFVEILNSYVEVIPQQFFINFPILSRFYAQNVSISTLNPLRNCEQLNHLFLSSNNLVSLAANLFADCANLQTLHLQNNLIETVERFAFRNLNRLEVLQLANNQIEIVNADLFTETPELIDLGLSNNRISTLNSRTLTPIPHLEVLRLANNNISILNVNILQDLTKLNTLLLNGNEFDNFQANFFRHLPNLRQLNINDNKVSRVNQLQLCNLLKILLHFSSHSFVLCNSIKTRGSSAYRWRTILSLSSTPTLFLISSVSRAWISASIRLRGFPERFCAQTPVWYRSVPVAMASKASKTISSATWLI